MEARKEISLIIGSNIRRTRLKAGIKAKALAAAIGVNPVSMTKYEKGTTAISAIRLILAADFLYVPVTASLPSEKQIKAIKKAKD